MKRRNSNLSLSVKVFLFVSCLVLVSSVGAFKGNFAQSNSERKLNVHTFTRMPLEVKEVRNLQKEGNFFRDLEIEVKNTSRYPLYFISILLEFPDVPAPTPTPHPETGYIPEATTGFTITYGADRLMNVMKLAGPDDIPLKPGETYVFKIPQSRVLGFESMNREMNLPSEAWNRIELSFDTISLGDGTGYEGGQRMLYSKKKSSEAIR